MIVLQTLIPAGPTPVSDLPTVQGERRPSRTTTILQSSSANQDHVWSGHPCVLYPEAQFLSHKHQPGLSPSIFDKVIAFSPETSRLASAFPGERSQGQISLLMQWEYLGATVS